jgi:hypothetical protein
MPPAIIHTVIRPFADAATEDLFNGLRSRRARASCGCAARALAADVQSVMPIDCTTRRLANTNTGADPHDDPDTSAAAP